MSTIKRGFQSFFFLNANGNTVCMEIYIIMNHGNERSMRLRPAHIQLGHMI